MKILSRWNLRHQRSWKKELNEQIEALQMQLEKEREDEAVQMKQSEEVHLSLAGLDQQKTFIVENISRIDEEITRYEKRAGRTCRKSWRCI